MDNEKIKRIINWANGIKCPPFFLVIRPSFNCNLKCKSCVPHQNNAKDVISDRTYVKLIKNLVKIGIKECRIDGAGESLMRKELVLKIMDILKEGGVRGNLTSNCTLLNEEDIKKIVKMGWDSVQVSIQGGSEKSDDSLRGVPGTFRKTINVIEKFNKYKKRFKKIEPYLILSPLIHSKNFKELPNFIELAKKHNCSIIVQSIQDWSEQGKDLLFKKDDLTELKVYVSHAKYLAGKYGISHNIQTLNDLDLVKHTITRNEIISKEVTESRDKLKKVFNKFSGLPCYEPWYFFMVNEFGKAGICVGDFKGRISVKNRKIEDIWYCKEFEKIRKSILRKELPHFCRMCCFPQMVENRRLRKLVSSALSPINTGL